MSSQIQSIFNIKKIELIECKTIKMIAMQGGDIFRFKRIF